MGLMCSIVRPESRYKKDISCTYEAREIVVGDEYKSYFADTIYALVEYLAEYKVEPDEVELYEIFKHEEKKLNKEYCVSEEGRWLNRKELCFVFTQRHPGHIHDSG